MTIVWYITWILVRIYKVSEELLLLVEFLNVIVFSSLGYFLVNNL